MITRRRRETARLPVPKLDSVVCRALVELVPDANSARPEGIGRMASPIRGIQSVDQQMLEHLKYSGIAQENLVDLVGLFVSLKNEYGLIPFAMTAESNPIPNAVTAKYTLP